MAKKKKTKGKPKYSITLIPLISIGFVFAIIILISLKGVIDIPAMSAIPSWNKLYEDFILAAVNSLNSFNVNSKIVKPIINGELEIHIIDVGQGDSILIKTPTKNVLIDAGENQYGETVLAYLNDQKIKNLDIVVATHPHADHIGGLDYVINNLPVNKVIMPQLPDNIVPTTRVYIDMLKAIEKQNLKITKAIPNEKYDLGNGAILTIIAPIKDMKSLNDMSVCARLDFGESSFLFTGDIEKLSENAILESHADIDVDVLDVAHHGSSGSNTANFLAKVTPKLATVSCGKNNDYGHPHKETVERLSKYCEIYRTDLDGSIVISTDGKTITLSSENGDIKEIAA